MRLVATEAAACRAMLVHSQAGQARNRAGAARSSRTEEEARAWPSFSCATAGLDQRPNSYWSSISVAARPSWCGLDLSSVPHASGPRGDHGACIAGFHRAKSPFPGWPRCRLDLGAAGVATLRDAVVDVEMIARVSRLMSLVFRGKYLAEFAPTSDAAEREVVQIVGTFRHRAQPYGASHSGAQNAMDRTK